MAHSHPLSSTQLFRCATVATDSPDSHRVGSKMSKARTSREPSRSVPRHRGLTNSWGTKTVTDLEKEQQVIKKKRCFWRNWFFEMFFICFVFSTGTMMCPDHGGLGCPMLETPRLSMSKLQRLSFHPSPRKYIDKMLSRIYLKMSLWSDICLNAGVPKCRIPQVKGYMWVQEGRENNLPPFRLKSPQKPWFSKGWNHIFETVQWGCLIWTGSWQETSTFPGNVAELTL